MAVLALLVAVLGAMLFHLLDPGPVRLAEREGTMRRLAWAAAGVTAWDTLPCPDMDVLPDGYADDCQGQVVAGWLPWRTLEFTVFTFVFLLPFLGLMNMATKKSPFWLALFAIIILVGMWMERAILVMPSLSPDHVWVGLPEIGVSFGFLGLFGWRVQGFVSRYPLVKVADVLDGHGGHGH